MRGKVQRHNFVMAQINSHRLHLLPVENERVNLLFVEEMAHPQKSLTKNTRPTTWKVEMPSLEKLFESTMVSNSLGSWRHQGIINWHCTNKRDVLLAWRHPRRWQSKMAARRKGELVDGFEKLSVDKILRKGGATTCEEEGGRRKRWKWGKGR